MKGDTMTDHGMVPVSKEEFFATVGRMDVLPSIVGEACDDERGYLSRWKLRDGRVVGVTFGGTHLMENKYGVAPEFSK